MDQMVISIDNSGKVEAMHNDAFDLSFLGKREIRRASDIVFEDDAWTIKLNDGNGAFTVTSPALRGFGEYETARKFEVQWLNTCRLLEIDPTSDKGLHEVAQQIRAGGVAVSYSSA